MVSDPACPMGPAMAIVFHFSPSTVIEEKGLKLKLTVTDTPGFGDQINNDKWWVLGMQPLSPQGEKVP